MKYLIIPAFFLALNVTAQSYAPNSGTAAPGAFSTPSGLNDVPPTRTTPSTDQMNTAPTPAPEVVEEGSNSFGTLQATPKGKKVDRQAQEDALDYSTNPKSTRPVRNP